MTRRTILQCRRTLLFAAILFALVPFAFAQPEGGGGEGGPPMPPGASFASPSDETGTSESDSSSEAGAPNDAHGASAMGEAVIQVDPETGSLVVICDEETHRRIEQIVASLDRPVPQVLIKVLFLEVTHTNGLDVGVEGSFKYGSDDRKDTIETLFGLASETRGGFYRVLGDDLEITMRAIATSGKLEVLSRPSVLARNNQEAVITVGQEVPFIRNSRITDNGQTINTIEYEDIGIILRVTPRIRPDRMVEMYVAPEISTLTGDSVQISETVNAQVIAKRSAETHVLVADGETVVIGGMMEDNDVDTVHKVPLLGDIPFLGALFRRTQHDKSKTELLIFLTPHVVETQPELRQVSLTEKNKAQLAPQVFSPEQMDKYIDNLEE
ncbi:type II secretion system protein GspD [Candidatus Sumerlaeota bacterium]|nr:type II secretion system protein GspD [Candidatus Sumerlaeota bacterium]